MNNVALDDTRRLNMATYIIFNVRLVQTIFSALSCQQKSERGRLCAVQHHVVSPHFA